MIVSGSVAERPARMVGADEPIVLAGPPPRFVGRGGDKLDAALDTFGLDVAGARGLDGGASTGGFTDCLLQRGAATVVAVDVGRGQLHERLRRDPRVTVRERTNIRTATLDDLGGEPFDVVVGDLSFISLRTVAPVLVDLARPAAPIVVLVKPQFEAGRREAARGKGVIRDPEVWKAALDSVITAFDCAGASMMGVMVSPLQGADGNVEFFAHLTAAPARRGIDPPAASDEPPTAAVQIARAVHEAATGPFRSPRPFGSPRAAR